MTAETDDGPYKRQSTLAISWVVQPNLVFQQDQLFYTGSFKLFVNFYVCKSKNSAARLDGLEILKIVSPLILRIWRSLYKSWILWEIGKLYHVKKSSCFDMFYFLFGRYSFCTRENGSMHVLSCQELKFLENYWNGQSINQYQRATSIVTYYYE